jgi:predicted acyltransferase
VKKRLLSIDALRGFDMLLISGGGTFVYLLGGKTDWPWLNALAEQFEHPAWNGFTFYDFIFPLFLFLAGVSLTFSVSKGLEIGLTKRQIYRKSAFRMLVLILLGILYKNSPVPIWEPDQIRLGSVLGRIGLASFVGVLLFLNFDLRKRIFWLAGILIVYYLALFLIPVPGYGAGDLSFEGNLVGWFDRTFMPGRLLQGTYDELAILTQFPSICLTIFGTLAGEMLQREWSERQKVGRLLIVGAGCIIVSLIWNLHFPINKHLWSSSFVMLTAGMAFLFLALFYWVIEIQGYTKWAFFFKVIGMNSLLIYLGYRFIDFNHTSELLFSGVYKIAAEEWQEVFRAIGALLLVWLGLYIMYRKKIFVKV